MRGGSSSGRRRAAATGATNAEVGGRRAATTAAAAASTVTGAEQTGRRAAGTLEAAVLAVLWNAAGPLSPGEVRELLAKADAAQNESTQVDAAQATAAQTDTAQVAGARGAELSYSTVVTILTRLHEKRALTRERDGRAYRYAPVSDEAGLAARRLTQLLDGSANREAVLSRFVADLSERDEQLLRDLLGERGGSVPGPRPGTA